MDVIAQRKVQVRWLIRRDMDHVMAIERASFSDPWSEEEFLCCLRQKNTIGRVAEINYQIVGYMIYELHKRVVRIANFAVDPEYRRQDIGTAMLASLKERIDHRRSTITAEIRDSNLTAHQFFAANDFLALSVLPQYFLNGEDAYRFECQVRRSA